MKNKARNKRLVRVLAIILAVLLVGGMLFGSIVDALSEPALPGNAERDRYEMELEYLADEQALRVTQRLIYTNRSPNALDRVVFYAAGNMFRRESALMYESADLETVFYAGYAPGGVDLLSVRFDGAPADYGFQGTNEMYLRVGCALEPGESGAFEFEYYLLLTRCAAFQGVGETDIRLSAFYFIPGVYDHNHGEFVFKSPLPYTRWLYSDAADYAATVRLPRGYELAATGEEALTEKDGAQCVWQVEAADVREFALSFGRRYRIAERDTASGVRVRVLSNVRGGDQRALDAAVRTVEQCEDWFGGFPADALDVVQSDYPLDALNFPGVIWVSNDLLTAGESEALAKQLRFCVAQQYFGLSAYVEPVADAWLSDAVCEYIAYLLLEADSRDGFLRAVNRDWVSALQLTLPGRLTVTSDAALFDSYSYDVVVRARGAVVLHELRLAMGLQPLLDGLAEFYRMGRDGRTLTEMDLVTAMDAVSGGSWEDFLTDWVFNVGEYVNQTIDWFE